MTRGSEAIATGELPIAIRPFARPLSAVGMRRALGVADIPLFADILVRAIRKGRAWQ